MFILSFIAWQAILCFFFIFPQVIYWVLLKGIQNVYIKFYCMAGHPIFFLQVIYWVMSTLNFFVLLNCLLLKEINYT